MFNDMNVIHFEANVYYICFSIEQRLNKPNYVKVWKQIEIVQSGGYSEISFYFTQSVS